MAIPLLIVVEQPTLTEHLCSPLVFSGARATRSLVLYVCFVDRCLSFVLFLLAIVLSVLQLTDSDYPYGIFKLFLLVYFISDYIYNNHSLSCDIVSTRVMNKLEVFQSKAVYPFVKLKFILVTMCGVFFNVTYSVTWHANVKTSAYF